MDAGDLIQLVIFGISVLGTAVWTVSRMETTGTKLDKTLTDLSADVKVLSRDVSTLTVVVKSLENGHQDHEERIRRIERHRHQ